MFAPIWILSIRVVSTLRRFMPTNILLTAIFTRRGLKWGMLALPIAAAYLLGAVLLAGLLAQGAPAWVSLFVLLCFWNTFKLLVAAPVSLLRLAYTRVREAKIRRRMLVPVLSEGVELERATRAEVASDIAAIGPVRSLPARVWH